MPIYENNNGINRTITTPYQNINGVWQPAKALYTNENGAWKEVWPGGYKVNLYKYGSLVTTLTCSKGSSIQLISVPVDAGDNSHYGWTTSNGATYRNYTPTQVITPTADMNLYAVFAYTGTVYTTTYSQVTSSAYLQRDDPGPQFTFSGALDNIRVNYGGTAYFWATGTYYDQQQQYLRTEDCMQLYGYSPYTNPGVIDSYVAVDNYWLGSVYDSTIYTSNNPYSYYVSAGSTITLCGWRYRWYARLMEVKTITCKYPSGQTSGLGTRYRSTK